MKLMKPYLPGGRKSLSQFGKETSSTAIIQSPVALPPSGTALNHTYEQQRHNKVLAGHFIVRENWDQHQINNFNIKEFNKYHIRRLTFVRMWNIFY